MMTQVLTIVEPQLRAGALVAVLAVLPLAGFACVGSEPEAPGLSPQQQLFWQHLQALCGNAYEGSLVEGAPGDTALAQASFVVHFKTCEPGRIVMPLHVGDDHSRVLILARSDSGLALRHLHFTPEGEPEELSGYGGHTFSRGTPQHQGFAADSITAAMAPGAEDNVWTLGVLPGELFAYGLRRANGGGQVRIEFDLNEMVENPPEPWASRSVGQ